MGCFPGRVWKVLSLLEALGSKLPTQKHQTHLERGSRMQGWVCICWDQEQLILTPDPDPALAHLLTPLPSQLRAQGSVTNQPSPHLCPPISQSCRKENSPGGSPTGIATPGVCRVDQKGKIPAGSSKLKLSFGLRPGAHPTLSGHRNSQLLAVFGVKAELSHN